ncbi:MAG: hypothetical protein KDD45_16165 [Bdellovibrionales bacterium]|nr:hypothetical protein [Bdellovibrionales bacterium]
MYHQWDQLRHVPQKATPQFVHLVSPNEVIGGIWLESALDGEIIYARNDSLKKRLSYIRKQIAEGKYQRKTSHGHLIG